MPTPASAAACPRTTAGVSPACRDAATATSSLAHYPTQPAQVPVGSRPALGPDRHGNPIVRAERVSPRRRAPRSDVRSVQDAGRGMPVEVSRRPAWSAMSRSSPPSHACPGNGRVEPGMRYTPLLDFRRRATSGPSTRLVGSLVHSKPADSSAWSLPCRAMNSSRSHHPSPGTLSGKSFVLLGGGHPPHSTRRRSE